METIKRLNEMYQKIFHRERLRLVTNWEHEKLDILSKMVIKDVEYSGEGYLITFQVENAMAKYKRKTLIRYFYVMYKNKTIEFEDEEIAEIQNWWDEMEIWAFISQVEKEKREAQINHAKNNHIDLKIKNVELDGLHIVYTLENGDKIRHKVV